MEKTVFRNKSIDRISSPEQLNDYVRVSNPGVWTVLVAIIILLIGVCVWGIFGHMETIISTAVIVRDGKAVCYVKEKDMENVQPGKVVRIDDNEYEIENIPTFPISISADVDSYATHVGSLSVGEWVYEVTFSTPLPDGVYEGKLVIQSVNPISFLLN